MEQYVDHTLVGVKLDPSQIPSQALAAAELELGPNPNALAIRRPFDPAAHDLDPSFRLTKYTDLKG